MPKENSPSKKKRKKRPEAALEKPSNKKKKPPERESSSSNARPSVKKKSTKSKSSKNKRPTAELPRKKRPAAATKKSSSKKKKRKATNYGRKPKRNPLKIILSVFSSLLFLSLLAVTIIFMLFFGRGQITGDDMEPTLYDKETIIYRQLNSESAADSSENPNNVLDLERSDIVLMRSPEDRNQIVVKRIIGLPGETVYYENGQLFVDNQWETEKYYEEANSSFYAAPENNFTMEEILQATPDLADSPNIANIIPENRYLVLGDNRTVAVDSRQFGLVSADDILGKIEYLLMPLSRFGKVE